MLKQGIEKRSNIFSEVLNVFAEIAVESREKGNLIVVVEVYPAIEMQGSDRVRVSGSLTRFKMYDSCQLLDLQPRLDRHNQVGRGHDSIHGGRSHRSLSFF
jgi:hypothetical protein